MGNIVPRLVGSSGDPAAIVNAVPRAVDSTKRRQWNYSVQDLRRLRSDANRCNCKSSKQGHPDHAHRCPESHVASPIQLLLKPRAQLPACALPCTVAEKGIQPEENKPSPWTTLRPHGKITQGKKRGWT